MGLFAWMDSKIQQMHWWHISLTKLSVFAFTLMLVTWWPVLASLDWWVYLIVFIVASIPVMVTMFKE